MQTSGSSVSFATVWLAAQLHRQLQTQQQAPQGTVVIWLAGSVSTGHKGSSVAEQVAGADEPLATIGQPSEHQQHHHQLEQEWRHMQLQQQ